MISSSSRTVFGILLSDLKLLPFYLAVSSLVLIGYVVDGFSTLRHFSTFIILFFVASSGGLSLTKGRYTLGLTALLFYSILASLQTPSLYTLKTAALILSPLLAASFLSSSKKAKIDQFIITFFFVAVAFQSFALMTSKASIASLGALQLLSSIGSSDVLLSTNSEIESSLGMVFGYLSLFFLTNRKFRYFTFCFILFLLNYKRIVLVGFVLAIGYHFLSGLNRRHRVPLRVLMYSSPFMFLALLIEISSGNLNEFISGMFGRSINHITTGRYAIHHELFARLFGLPRLFFGYGIGHTHQTVGTFNFTHMALAHSDYLMLFYDFGIICFMVLFFLFFKTFLTSRRNAVYIIYFLVLLIFDNTFIYFDTMFILYLLLINSQKSERLSLESS